MLEEETIREHIGDLREKEREMHFSRKKQSQRESGTKNN